MKHKTLGRICIVLALVTLVSLELASFSGRTFAYLTDSEVITNSFTFRQQQIGPSRRDTVNYYYLNSSGGSTQIRDSGYTNVIWNMYHAGEMICATENNPNIMTPPNGFKISYLTIKNVTIQAGNCAAHPNGNNNNVHIYFEPITYSISYDYNGYSASDIIFAHTPLQSSYTVFDKIDVPYGNDVQVQGNTFVGWMDQNNNLHTANNASGSWASALGSVQNSSVYGTFAGRQAGNLILTAEWQNQVNPNRAVSNINTDDAKLDEEEPGDVKNVEEQTE